jgi:cytochrome c oxidase assembly protein subunit 15
MEWNVPLAFAGIPAASAARIDAVKENEHMSFLALPPGKESSAIPCSNDFLRSGLADPAASTSHTTPVARFAWLTLGSNIFVVVWGAFVRASGSGAGCGNHWPLCGGSILPGFPEAQTVIEFFHRATSAAALAMVLFLLVWCWRKTSKGAWPRYSAVLAFVLLLNEGLLGALLVISNNVAQNPSLAHAFLLGLHFGNTLLLLGSLSLTAQWLSDGNHRFAVTAVPGERLAVGLGLGAVMMVGITGSLAALADTIFPAASLRSSLLQDFSSSTHHLLRLRLLHPAVVVLGVIYVLWVIRKSAWKRVHSVRMLHLLSATLILQIALGGLNIVLLAPVWLQLTHLFVADLFWIFVVLASADFLLEVRKPQKPAR